MSIKDILLLAVCILSAIVSIWKFWEWINIKIGTPAGGTLIVSIVCLVIAVVCGLLFLIPRVNKEEEIHITQ